MRKYIFLFLSNTKMKKVTSKVSYMLLAFFWFFSLLPGAAFTEDAVNIVDLGTVLVDKESEAEGFNQGFIIGEENIDQPRISRTVDGLLAGVPGIDMRRTSVGGNTGSEVILRGFDESRYLVLLDGRPVNGSGVFGGEYVDWSSLSTEDIDRVDVTRGAGSAEYGNTLGGTINIITKKGSKKNKIGICSSYGSFNTVYAAASQHGNLRGFLYEDISYGYWRTDGYLRNNYVSRNNYSGRLKFIFPEDLSIGLGMRYTAQRRGFVVENKKENTNFNSRYPESNEDAGGGPHIQWFGKPGPFGPVNPSKYWGDGSYWKNKRGQYDIEINKKFDLLNIKANGYLNRQERTEYYYAIDNENKLVLERYTEPERSGGWLLKLSMPCGEHDIVYGAEGVYLGYGKQTIINADSTYFRRQPSSSAAPKKTSRRHAIFTQGSWKITDALEIGAGLRYDNYWAKPSDVTYEYGLSPNVSVKYHINKELEVKGYFGQAYRFPTSPESYWYFEGYDPPGRKKLSPERALQAEAGIIRKFKDKGEIRCRGYYYDVDNYIRTIFGYTPSRVVYNIDKVRLWGMEAEGRYSLTKDLQVFVNYTWQITQKEGDILDRSSDLTDRLSELPENKLNAGLKYSFLGLITDFTMRYVDKREVITGDLSSENSSELVSLKGFAVFDLKFEYNILEKDDIKGTITFGIENIFDASYAETEGFPMPGRVLTGGIKLTF